MFEVPEIAIETDKHVPKQDFRTYINANTFSNGELWGLGPGYSSCSFCALLVDLTV